MKDLEFNKQNSIDSLVSKLGLPSNNYYGDHWESEVCDHKRTREWLCDYQRSDLNDEERYFLMLIIIESMDDAIQHDSVTNQEVLTLKRLLKENYTLHRHVLDDFANWEETDLENLLPISPLIREIILEVKDGPEC
ncbi:MAG: hypothetical protein NXI29_23065 [bacterium]|nr:hypothetical protein [bacterium]